MPLEQLHEAKRTRVHGVNTEAVVSQAADIWKCIDYPWTVLSFYAAVLTCVGIGFALASLIRWLSF